jgi:HrpA-like RNA helicase
VISWFQSLLSNAACTATAGSGKTTQVPQFVLEDAVAAGRGGAANIIVAQPRRVAAVSIARRVAEERGERVGDTVGYQVRGDSAVSKRTRLTFMTTGVLLRKLVGDPALTGVTHIFVDEVHERTADADFLLIHLKGLLQKQAAEQKRAAATAGAGAGAGATGSPLRVVLMSATVDGDKIRDYFEGTGAPGAPPPAQPHIPGRAYNRPLY